MSNSFCAYNYLISGVAGSGKSWLANEMAKEIVFKKDGNDIKRECHNIVRTVFSNGIVFDDFFGGYKPYSYKKEKKSLDRDDAGNKKEGDALNQEGIEKKGDAWITEYLFQFGPFGNLVVKALNEPDENFVLIIEEINRADVYYILGDLFQLLDRGEDGDSKYKISISEGAISAISSWYEKGKSDILDKVISEKKIFLPKNFYIIATVCYDKAAGYKLDTAFKRRFWNIYIEEEEMRVYGLGENSGYNRLFDSKESKFKSEKSLFISEKNISNFINRINEKILVEDTLSDDKLISNHFFKLQEENGNKGLYEDVFLTNVIGYLSENVFYGFESMKRELVKEAHIDDLKDTSDIIGLIKKFYEKKKDNKYFYNEFFNFF